MTERSEKNAVLNIPELLREIKIDGKEVEVHELSNIEIDKLIDEGHELWKDLFLNNPELSLMEPTMADLIVLKPVLGQIRSVLSKASNLSVEEVEKLPISDLIRLIKGVVWVHNPPLLRQLFFELKESLMPSRRSSEEEEATPEQ